MINHFIYLSLILGLVGIVWLNAKNNSLERFGYGPVGGDNGDEDKNRDAALQILINQYKWQQKMTFVLLWSSIVLGVIMGFLIVLKFAFLQDKFDLNLISGGTGLVGEVSFSVGSFKLYEKASKRLDNLATCQRDTENEK